MLENVKVQASILILIVLLAVGFFNFFNQDLLNGVGVGEKLKHHTENMPTAQIIKVRDKVWVAVGYALANSVLIEGRDGAIVVDTTESLAAANAIAREFRTRTEKPIRDIVYTHSHADHVTGTAAFVKNLTREDIRVWAHASFDATHVRTMMSGPRVNWGAIHQFGTQLGKHRSDCGIGESLVLDELDDIPYPIFPDRLIRESVEKHVVQGLELTFIHIPGETSDQMGVWIDEWKLLLPGDDIYRAFPNIYAIRGTPPRSALEWADSLRRMRSLDAEILVPSHTLPAFGRNEINDLFTVYLSAIRFVHDQTLRFINKGWNPEDVSRLIKLPGRVREHPYIQEFYGKTTWSSKAVAENYIGWFSGDPVDLQPHTPAERASRMCELVGDSKLFGATKAALKKEDNQWALELSSHLVRCNPKNGEFRRLKLESLRALAATENTPTARHYYLTEALSLYDRIDYKVLTRNVIMATHLDNLFTLMTTKLKAEEVEDVNATVSIVFTDVEVSYRLTLQFSVLLVDKFENGAGPLPNTDLTVTTTSLVWRELMSQQRNPLLAYMKGDIVIEGGLLAFRTFMSYFEKSNE